MNQRILGVDPGTHTVGVAVINTEPLSLEHTTPIEVRAKTPESCLAYLREALYLFVSDLHQMGHLPDLAVVEDVFIGYNSKGSLALAQARGALLAAIGCWDIPVVGYSPTTVKEQVTGHGHKDKLGVAEGVAKVLHLNDSPIRSEHEWDAIAIALTPVLLARP